MPGALAQAPRSAVPSLWTEVARCRIRVRPAPRGRGLHHVLVRIRIRARARLDGQLKLEPYRFEQGALEILSVIWDNSYSSLAVSNASLLFFGGKASRRVTVEPCLRGAWLPPPRTQAGSSALRNSAFL